MTSVRTDAVSTSEPDESSDASRPGVPTTTCQSSASSVWWVSTEASAARPTTRTADSPVQ